MFFCIPTYPYLSVAFLSSSLPHFGFCLKSISLCLLAHLLVTCLIQSFAASSYVHLWRFDNNHFWFHCFFLAILGPVWLFFFPLDAILDCRWQNFFSYYRSCHWLAGYWQCSGFTDSAIWATGSSAEKCWSTWRKEARRGSRRNVSFMF